MSRRPVASLVVLAVALLSALALAACGDGSLSAKQLRAQASEICARTFAATDRISIPSRPSQGGAFLAEGVARLRPAARRLAALKAPEELRDRYERAVSLAAREVAVIARHERAIRDGEDVIETYRSLDRELEPLTVQEDTLWRGLEIPACVRR